LRSILFHFFGLPVHAYGAAIAVAFVFAVWHIRKLAEREGYKGDVVVDAAIAAMISAIVGARLFHVFTPSEWVHYRQHPGDIFAIWEGGLTFYGGLLGCLVVLPFVFRFHKVAFWNIADCFAPAVALGHGIVRLGCFMNGCCYGKPVSWGIKFPELGDGIPRQPSQLYEAAVGVILFFVLMSLWPVRRFRGQLWLLYLLFYAVARFAIEYTRDDERGGLGWFSTSQWVAIGVAIVAGALWPWLARTRRISPPEAEKAPAAP